MRRREEKLKEKIKKRRKLKRKILLIILIILVVLLYDPVSSIIKLKSKGYSLYSAYKIYDKGVKGVALDNEYSKTLEKIITSSDFDKKYVESYVKIDYYDEKDFINNINTWLPLGYNSDDINGINKYDSDVLNKKVSEKYISDILKYLSFDYFKVDKLDRYLNYYDGDYQKTIVYVNIGLDKEYYKDPEVVKDYSINMLVNKYNKLGDVYEPKDLTELTKCSDRGHSLSKEAKLAYDKLCDASIKDGMHLGVTSSYRSYESQQDVYAENLKSNGKEYTVNYVASPGFSEHQTGLALDVKSTVSSPFKTTKEYKWMLENAHKYGFILRFPEGKENLTGFNAEAWHYRYVGVDIATFIYNNDLTYEEYCAMYM